MGNNCFNCITSDKDLQLQKKPFEEDFNSEIKTISNYDKYASKTNINEKNQSKDIENSFLTPNISNKYNNNMLIKNIPIIHMTKRSNSFILKDGDKKKRIYKFTREELEDEINDILVIRIPFFENNILKTLSSFTFLSGNGPYHEGLMFFTTNKNFYIAQSYPITFIKVYDFYAGISEIISFNNLNSNSKKYSIPEIYMPQQKITLFNVLNIINNLPNKYDLLIENCQNFCNNILETLKNKYRIDLDDNPSKEKINFLKNQQKNRKGNMIPFKKTSIYASGRFNK
jgi:hypothetical protein